MSGACCDCGGPNVAHGQFGSRRCLKCRTQHGRDTRAATLNRLAKNGEPNPRSNDARRKARNV